MFVLRNFEKALPFILMVQQKCTKVNYVFKLFFFSRMKIPGQMTAAVSPSLHLHPHSAIAAVGSRKAATPQIVDQLVTAMDLVLAAAILVSLAAVAAVTLAVMVITGGLLLMKRPPPDRRRCRNLFRRQLTFQVQKYISS